MFFCMLFSFGFKLLLFAFSCYFFLFCRHITSFKSTTSPSKMDNLILCVALCVFFSSCFFGIYHERLYHFIKKKYIKTKLKIVMLCVWNDWNKPSYAIVTHSNRFICWNEMKWMSLPLLFRYYVCHFYCSLQKEKKKKKKNLSKENEENQKQCNYLIALLLFASESINSRNQTF